MRLGIDWDEEDAAEQVARQEKASKTRNTATVAAEPAVANAVAPPTAAAQSTVSAAAPPTSPTEQASAAKAPQSFAESVIRKTEPYWNPIHLKPGVKEFKSYEDIDPYATAAHGLAEFFAYQHGIKPILGGISQGVANRISNTVSGVDPTIKAQVAATNAKIESNEKIAAMKYGQLQGPDRAAVPTSQGRIEPTFDTTPLPDGPSPNNPEAIATNSAKPNPLDLYAQQKHGVSLATLEQASGGPLTKQADIDIIANQFNKGQGITVNTLPGKISNQPPGVPGANPMDQLTKQPPAPQLMQPKPPAGAVAPQPMAAAPAAPTSVSEAVAGGVNPTQAVNQTIAQEIDSVQPETVKAAPAKKTKGVKPPVETELRPGYEFRPGFGTSDTYLVDTIGPEKYKIARMELNEGKPFGKYDQNLVKNVMEKYRVGERITKEVAKAAGAGAMSSPGGVPSKSIQRGLKVGGVLGMGLPAWLAARASELPGFDEAMARANEAAPGMGTSANAMPFSRGEEMSKMGNAYVTAGNPNYRAELQQQIAVEQDPKRLNQLIGELQKTGAVGGGRGIAPPTAYQR